MIDETQIQLQARLTAIEFLLPMVIANGYAALKVDREYVGKLHEGLIDKLRNETFEGADPALSDLMASEIEDQVKRTLQTVEAIFDNARRKPQ